MLQTPGSLRPNVVQLEKTFLTVGRRRDDASAGVVHEFNRDLGRFVQKRTGPEFAVADPALVVLHGREEEDEDNLLVLKKNYKDCDAFV